MYHWFLLIKSSRDASAKCHSGAALGFFDHDSLFAASLNGAERRRLFWLGAIEMVPALGGGIGSSFAESGSVQASIIVAGFVLCATLCWLLLHKTPLTRIYASDKQARSEPLERRDANGTEVD